LRDLPQVARIDAWQAERIAKIRREQQRERTRALLLRTPIRVLRKLSSTFAKADERR
jgi:hypothetical protein